MILLRIYKLLLLTITIFSIFASTSTYAENQDNNIKNQLQMFGNVLNGIQQIYVDEVSYKELIDHAIKGMLNGLDPHSDYLKPREQKSLIENSSGKFGGLGIVISMKNDLIEIISPIDDTPAYRAGLQSGDLIVKIGNKSVRGMTIADGVSLMRGKPATNIKLTIVRNSNKPFEVEITREIITIVSVKSHLLEKDIGYIRISNFQKPTVKLLKTQFKQLTKQNDGALKSLIIDLRNNPGGLLKSAVDIANLFIDKKGLIVYTKGRANNSNSKFKTTSGDIMNGAPIVVLINEGSASASEIVAGALQDHKRAIIMGSASFGKGSVQTIIEINDGYGIKLTTARYYTPSGHSIQAKGIKPDIQLENIYVKKETSTEIANIKEKNLTGHLKIENPTNISKEEILKSQKNKSIQAKTKTKKNLQEDYFIHQATNLLKSTMILSNIF